MSFTPIVPFTGLQGWQFLSRTLERQSEAFSESATNQRETEYFSEKISKVSTAEDLVNDPQLLRVALTAFGLEDDAQNKFLIKKVLEDGVLDPESIANRFSDKRYFELSKAFGFGELEITKTSEPDFSQKIIGLYEERKFEVAVGEVDEDLRLALSFKSGVADIISSATTETSRWLAVLGNPPLKQVIETALRVPSGAGSVDLDQQVEFLQDRFEALTGKSSFSDLADEAVSEQVLRNFLLISEVGDSSALSGSRSALQLLQSIPKLTF